MAVSFETSAQKKSKVLRFRSFPKNWQSEVISTEQMLAYVNWEKLKEFCLENPTYYTREQNQGLLKTYRFFNDGYDVHFEIKSYEGRVLEFESDIPKRKHLREVNYISSEVWRAYGRTAASANDRFIVLGRDEPAHIVKAIYQLIGTGDRLQYGWTCEYSTSLLPTIQRQGVMTLMRDGRIEVLKDFMKHPRPEIALYAIDALIYLDRTQDILTEADWETIFKLRDSGQVVTTCGITERFKDGESPISQILSQLSIAKIDEEYANLLGY